MPELKLIHVSKWGLGNGDMLVNESYESAKNNDLSKTKT